MFATLRTRHDSLLVERAGANATFSACSSCRSKKLRCTGEVTGCHRCMLSQTKCEYPDAAARKKSRPVKPSTSKQTVPVDVIPEPRSRRLTRGNVSKAASTGSDDTSGTCSTAIDPSNPHIWGLEPFGTITEELGFSSNNLDALLESPDDLHSTLGSDSFLLDYFHTTQDPDCENRHPEIPQMFFQHPRDGNTSSCPSPLTPISTQRERVDSPALTSPAHLRGPGNATEACGSCRCTYTAVELMETLTLDEFDEDPSSISHILQGRKHALQTCFNLCECQSCVTTSKFLLLIIHICGKAVTSYGKLIQELDVQSEVSELSFGVYDVSAEEQSLVSRTLIVFQLKEWKILLGRLAEQCRDLGFLKHMHMALGLDKIVQKQILESRLSD